MDRSRMGRCVAWATVAWVAVAWATIAWAAVAWAKRPVYARPGSRAEDTGTRANTVALQANMGANMTGTSVYEY